MAESDIAVCNLALARLGEDAISDFTEASEAARQCNRFYRQTVDEELRLNWWSFAREVKALSQHADAPADTDYDYSYQLPVNPYCLEVRNILGVTQDQWQIQERNLLCNLDEVTIVYTKRVTDPSMYDPLFTNALSLNLAYRICIPITGDKEMKGTIYLEYEIMIARARRSDAIERKKPPKNVRDDLASDPFLTAGR